jgi:hypothetical protein
MVRLIYVAETDVVVDQHRKRIFFKPARMPELGYQWQVFEFATESDEAIAVFRCEPKATGKLHQHGAKLLCFLDRANPLTESGNVFGLKLSFVGELLPGTDTELEFRVVANLPAPELAELRAERGEEAGSELNAVEIAGGVLELMKVLGLRGWIEDALPLGMCPTGGSAM